MRNNIADQSKNNEFQKYLVKVRKQIIDNAKDLLNDAVFLFESGKYQRATFDAMTCIEECGKLFLLRNLGFKDKNHYISNKKEIDKLLRDHTGKALQTAVTSFFINSGADRRQGVHPTSNELRTSGIILLTKSNKWMEWRNSCLYVDANLANNFSKTPIESIGKSESYYFICIAYEALAENAENGYGTINPMISDKNATNFWQSKLKELDEFMKKHNKIDIDKIDFLMNPQKYN